MNNPFEHPRRRSRGGRSRPPGEPRGLPPPEPLPVTPAAGEPPTPPDPPTPPVFRAPGSHWRGITWEDVPGHDEPTQRLNFTLLRRGILSGHKSCRALEGESLKAELRRISSRNRGNSRLSYKRAEGKEAPAADALPSTSSRSRAGPRTRGPSLPKPLP